MEKIRFDFSSIRDLRGWLERKKWNSESQEAFDNWMQDFFNDGHQISVNDKKYEYWDCWELI